MFNLLKSWRDSEDGMAAVEAAMIFPIMLTMLLAIYDLGNGILANQKAVRASQVVADLITRQSIVNDTDIDEAIEAGRLAFEPMDSSSYGVDIVSMRFDDDADTEVLWRETLNMSSLPDAISAVDALRDANEGVVMVSVRYVYSPLFSAFMTSDIEMGEVAFSRGRSSPAITRE
ncbi:MAG: TadE/TadG family type IV pilus assembly protein [Alphaproteobacteria bacterium]